MGLSLNLDVSASVFYEPMFFGDFIEKFLNKDLAGPLTDEDRIKANRALKGVRMEVKRPDYTRRYNVHGLTIRPIDQLTFPDENGAVITVVQYFHDIYGVNLRYPSLPAIQAGSQARIFAN
ncbi:putative post-transcriptional gene silencing PAZ-Argonaute family [Helianthus anomalus]